MIVRKKIRADVQERHLSENHSQLSTDSKVRQGCLKLCGAGWAGFEDSCRLTDWDFSSSAKSQD